MELNPRDIIKTVRENLQVKNPNFKRFLLGVAGFVILSSILLVNFFPARLTGIELGKPSKQTIKAPKNIEFIDNEMTEKLRNDASKNVDRVYKYDPVTITRVDNDISGFYNSLREANANAALTPDAREDMLKKKFKKRFPTGLLKTALSLSPEEITAFEAKTTQIAEQLMGDKILKQDLKTKKQEFEAIASALPYEESKKDVIYRVGSTYLEPNYTYDAEATQKLKDEAVAKVPPFAVKRMKGETIVREGEIVTAEHIMILEQFGMLSGRIDFSKILGVLLLVVGLLLVLGIYLLKYQKVIYERFKSLILLMILLIGITVLAKAATSFQIPSYMIPVAAVAMLVTILFNSRTAIVMVVMSALVTSVIAENSAQYLTVSILGGLLAIYLVSRISKRTDLTRAGIITGFGMAYLGFSISLIAGMGTKDVLEASGWCLASGFSSALLTIGILPLFEAAFDITTDIRLLELSDSSQPLLKELMMKAPGTHNHSIIAANLAEGAAEKVGAQPILSRVGCYYHDIGKVKRPFFFVENQLGCDNPHDHTKPSLSYLIVTAHVKDGVEMARKHRLPSEIVDIIREHHGTSVVTYFFHRAKEQGSKEKEVPESRFRYSGQKPQTKEAALVMLADSVEAAARTISKPSPNRLEQLIKKIIRTKLEDGQLDESQLTLRDLEKIAKSFSQGLTTMYHSRIVYPEGEVLQFKRGTSAHGSHSK